MGIEPACAAPSTRWSSGRSRRRRVHRASARAAAPASCAAPPARRWRRAPRRAAAREPDQRGFARGPRSARAASSRRAGRAARSVDSAVLRVKSSGSDNAIVRMRSTVTRHHASMSSRQGVDSRHQRSRPGGDDEPGSIAAQRLPRWCALTPAGRISAGRAAGLRSLQPFDQRHRGRRIAHLGAGDHVDEDVALPACRPLTGDVGTSSGAPPSAQARERLAQVSSARGG